MDSDARGVRYRFSETSHYYCSHSPSIPDPPKEGKKKGSRVGRSNNYSGPGL